MRKKSLLFVLFLVGAINSAICALPDSVGTKTIGGKRYVIHRVESSEGWYSIAREHGISYAELRLANKDSSDKLIPGRTILIPTDRLKSNDPHFGKNTIQNGEQLHNVEGGETLFSIAKKFETSVDSIKKWNKLSAKSLKKGQCLIVGYKTKDSKMEHELMQTKIIKTAVEQKQDTTMVIAKTTSVKTSAAGKTKALPENIVKGRKEVNEVGVAAWIRDDDVNPNKYYALHRTASVGTIIKVINKMNNKYVFVKVVGVLPDTGDNTDLIIKISKASAEKLGVHDLRFQSELNYGVNEKL